jgi:hypothetical protein
MTHPILIGMESKIRVNNMLAEAERRRLVQSAQSARSEQPEQRRLPKMSALRKLVASMGYTVL